MTARNRRVIQQRRGPGPPPSPGTGRRPRDASTRRAPVGAASGGRGGRAASPRPRTGSRGRRDGPAGPEGGPRRVSRCRGLGHRGGASTAGEARNLPGFDPSAQRSRSLPEPFGPSAPRGDSRRRTRAPASRGGDRAARDMTACAFPVGQHPSRRGGDRPPPRWRTALNVRRCRLSLYWLAHVVGVTCHGVYMSFATHAGPRPRPSGSH